MAYGPTDNISSYRMPNRFKKFNNGTEIRCGLFIIFQIYFFTKSYSSAMQRRATTKFLHFAPSSAMYFTCLHVIITHQNQYLVRYSNAPHRRSSVDKRSFAILHSKCPRAAVSILQPHYPPRGLFQYLTFT